MSDQSPSARWRHDIKNQLGIVLGYAELVLQDLNEAHPLRADVNEILKAAQQAMALVGELDESESE